MKSKTIQVSYMTKKELELIKRKMRFKRFDSVINYLLNGWKRTK